MSHYSGQGHSPLALFYLGTGTTQDGWLFEDIIEFTDSQLERGHAWVQWLFPLPEPSKAQPRSPVMNADDLQMFKTDNEVIDRVDVAWARWLDFIENNTFWCRERDHNHLRITRVIRFMTLIDRPNDAEQMYHTACGMMIHKGDGLPDQTKFYWLEARKKEPAWLRGRM